MNKIKIGINGFGRIGRNFFKAAYGHPNIEILAINDLTKASTLAHLLKYDSIFGTWNKQISVQEDKMLVDDRAIKILSNPKIEELKWGDLGIDIVLESTGFFTDAHVASDHIHKSGAKKVIISAPAKNEDKTIVMGVNHQDYDKNVHHVVSNASCTTNCLAPIAKIMLNKFGIEKGLMNTIHSFTNDQRILDLPHSDLRRARSAFLSMIPTTTGAAKAVSLVLPELKGKLDGMAIRVPTPNVSVVDVVFTLKKSTTKEEVNQTFKEATKENNWMGILDYTEEPLVSRDFLGNSHSSIIDGLSTSVIGDNLVKIISWYDNEFGYSNRLVDLASFMLSHQ